MVQLIGLILLGYTVFIWIVFHRCVKVLYFNIIKGVGFELLCSFIIAIILTALTLNYWYIVVIIIVLFSIGIIIKNPTANKPIIVIITAICCILISFIGIRASDGIFVSREQDEKPSTLDPKRYVPINNTMYGPTDFVSVGTTYKCENTEIIFINFKYPLSYKFDHISMNAMFTSEGIIDTRHITADFVNTEGDIYKYYLIDTDGEALNKNYWVKINDDQSVDIKYEESGMVLTGKYKLADESDLAMFNNLIKSYAESYVDNNSIDAEEDSSDLTFVKDASERDKHDINIEIDQEIEQETNQENNINEYGDTITEEIKGGTYSNADYVLVLTLSDDGKPDYAEVYYQSTPIVTGNVVEENSYIAPYTIYGDNSNYFLQFDVSDTHSSCRIKNENDELVANVSYDSL